MKTNNKNNKRDERLVMLRDCVWITSDSTRLFSWGEDSNLKWITTTDAGTDLCSCFVTKERKLSFTPIGRIELDHSDQWIRSATLNLDLDFISEQLIVNTTWAKGARGGNKEVLNVHVKVQRSSVYRGLEFLYFAGFPVVLKLHRIAGMEPTVIVGSLYFGTNVGPEEKAEVLGFLGSRVVDPRLRERQLSIV